MDTVNFGSYDNLAIGQVFTPLTWAEWAIAQGPYDDWLNGGTILDPTGGEGVFLEAFISKAMKAGRLITEEMLHRLYMVELDSALCIEAVRRCAACYGVQLIGSNIINEDFFTFRSRVRVSSIVGNPPWINFTDLPEAYKSFIKPFFVEYGLVPNLKSVLWGGARIDLAAAVVAKCAKDHCLPDAQMVLFVPLSLFMNDGAHHAFRELAFHDNLFGIQELHDMTKRQVFRNVNTRYCLAKLSAKHSTTFPIRYWHHETHQEPKCENARPHSRRNNSLTVGDSLVSPIVRVPKTSMPRQGVNTCGANKRFFFDEYSKVSHSTAIVANDEAETQVECSLLYPLITGKNFGSDEIHTKVYKYVLLPYDRATGKPLPQSVLELQFPYTWNYLKSISDVLKERKGKMLGQQIEQGQWWALLGVGPYTFSPHKIVWQAYGKDEFAPVLFFGDWVPNQSLQAYMSFQDIKVAQRVLRDLLDAELTEHLTAGRMAGTASWAQPGKIKTFLEPIDDELQLSLFH